ncbi:lipoxygenase family protein [Pluralibacter gergoviae]|uniref:lipoxygenase family protein n=1 Tax=Pluralibacter gergoviae TaxID=61647 RepID=UPI0007DAE43F|nr:lipoxygenase family protein [Pluralibacter gergoviae]
MAYVMKLTTTSGAKADGVEKNSATAILTDNNAYVPNVMLTFTLSDHALFDNGKNIKTVATSALGSAKVVFSDPVAETITVTAIDAVHELTQSAESTFVDAGAGADDYYITLTADSGAAPGDAQGNRVSAVLSKQDHSHVAGAQLNFSTSGSALFKANLSNTLTALTDASGNIETVLIDAVAESVDIDARFFSGDGELLATAMTRTRFGSAYSADVFVPDSVMIGRDRTFIIFGLINGVQATHVEQCVSNFHITSSEGLLEMYNNAGTFSGTEYSGKGFGDNENNLVLNLRALSPGDATLSVQVDFIDGTRFIKNYAISLIDPSQSVDCQNENTFIEKFDRFSFTKGAVFKIKYAKNDAVKIYIPEEGMVFDSVTGTVVSEQPGMTMVADYITIRYVGEYNYMILRANIDGRLEPGKHYYSRAYLTVDGKSTLTLSANDLTARDKYPWTEMLTPLIGVPMLDNGGPGDLPVEFHPRASYQKALDELYEEIAENHRQAYLSRIAHPTAEQRAAISTLAERVDAKYKNMFEATPVDIQDRDEQLCSLEQQVRGYCDKVESGDFPDPDLAMYDNQFKAFPRPDTARFIYDDDIFAYWRVGGCNPLALYRVNSLPDNFPLTAEQYRLVMGDGDTLEQALRENRIYMVNYSNLDGAVAEDGYTKVESGSSPEPIVGYSYLAMGLFSVSKVTKRLKPVAIQCGQDPNDAEPNPLFLAIDDEAHRWGWQQAKMVIQAADKTLHQLSSHLGLTHLLIEAFALATYRNLKKGHPVYDLLISHFEGTNRINHNATLQILGPNQFVDSLMAAPLGKLAQKAIDIRLRFNFYDNFLPVELKRRGVDDVHALPEYPYRDDGLLIWNAIQRWVNGYIDYFYDESIAGDGDLMAWIDDLVENGRINGFKRITRRAELADVLTMVIYTCSARHAAVNFAQHDWMMYSPAMSGTLAGKKPTSVDGQEKEGWLAMLPGFTRSMSRLDIYTLLGRLHNGYLGEYVMPDGEPIFTLEKNPDIYNLQRKFNDELNEITKTIQERNVTRTYPYIFLLPKNIPASINI